ncbi:rhodanese-like domain-containing protein [Streptosporangium canum]
MNRISREDLLALLEAGTVQLVEALPAGAFATEHIPGARNMPGQN